ncbi:methyltransferase domain-containing protein [Candidatus Woesearchaeota archaeon]|nr:methyltransferase domain-containing protein [Candidatus Woesearchaeota archaeon]
MDVYLDYHSKYLPKRTEQLRSLFQMLNGKISLSGNTVVSIGCGVAAEFPLLDFSTKIGVDFNPTLILFCKQKHEGDFVCENYMAYLDGLEDSSVDLVLALDIDTNIIPSVLIRSSLRVLKHNGSLVITERENNVNVYGRMLLLPFIEQIKKDFPLAEFKFYSRMNVVTSKDDRDNFVLTVKKI